MILYFDKEREELFSFEFDFSTLFSHFLEGKVMFNLQ